MWHLELNLEYILAGGWACQRCRWTSCCHKPYDKCSPEVLREDLKRLQEQAHLQARTRSGFGAIPLVPVQWAEQSLGRPRLSLGALHQVQCSCREKLFQAE